MYTGQFSYYARQYRTRTLFLSVLDILEDDIKNVFFFRTTTINYIPTLLLWNKVKLNNPTGSININYVQCFNYILLLRINCITYNWGY